MSRVGPFNIDPVTRMFIDLNESETNSTNFKWSPSFDLKETSQSIYTVQLGTLERTTHVIKSHKNTTTSLNEHGIFTQSNSLYIVHVYLYIFLLFHNLKKKTTKRTEGKTNQIIQTRFSVECLRRRPEPQIHVKSEFRNPNPR